MIFAELIAYINDVRMVSNIRPVFKLVDLKKMYFDRLRQVDGRIMGTPSLNSTRLKAKLLYLPFLPKECLECQQTWISIL